MKNEDPILGNFHFNLKIVGLGLLFWIPSLVIGAVFRDELTQMSWLARMGIAFLAAGPLFLTLLMIERRMNALVHDEFQQQRLMRQIIYASITALSASAIQGFTAEYDGRGNQGGYLFGILMWYSGWIGAAMLFKKEDE